MKHCAICRREINEENAPILAMGSFGNPRYLCDECASDIDQATSSRESSEIEAAMQKISEKLAATGAEDSIAVEAVTEIFTSAGDRAKRIKDGTYDFSEDEVIEEEDDVPEELRETEEDRAEDEKDAEKAKKFDKILNIVSACVFTVAIILMIIYFFR